MKRRQTSTLDLFLTSTLVVFPLVLVTFSSSKMSNLDYRASNQSIKIVIDRTTPPFFALELEEAAAFIEYKVPNVANSIQLQAGTHAVDAVIRMQMSGKQFVPEQPSYHPVQLPTLSISGQDIPRPEGVGLLPVQSARTQVSAQNVIDLGEQFIVNAGPMTDELRQDLKQQYQVSALSPVLDKQPAENLEETFVIDGVVMTSHKMGDTSGKHESISILADNTPTATTQEPPTDVQVAWISPPEKSLGQLRGFVTLQNGLALMGQHQDIVVRHVVDGHEKSSALVDLNSGSFKIVVDQPVGDLVAELISDEDEVVGEGKIKLGTVLSEPENLLNKNIEIKLSPRSTGIIGRVLSFYSDAYRDQPEKEAKIAIAGLAQDMLTDKNGIFHHTDMRSGSTYLASIRKAGYFNTTLMGVSGQSEDIFLFPRKLIHAFVKLAAQSLTLANDLSLVWGQIVDAEGKPVSGARVELLAQDMTSQNTSQAVYLNDLSIPDQSLKDTSRNGKFAIVTHGDQLVSVRVKGLDPRLHPNVEVIPAVSGSVFPLKLVLDKPSNVQVSVTDMLNSELVLPALVKEVGSALEYEYNPHQKILNMPVAHRKTARTLEAMGSEDYLPTRSVVMGTSREAGLKLVSKDWLNKLLANAKVMRDPQTGIILGNFPDTQEFEVVLEEGINLSRSNLVLFDRNGRLVFDRSEAVGGGFIILNIPVGFRAVTFLYNDAPHLDKISTQLILADTEYVSLINFSR